MNTERNLPLEARLRATLQAKNYDEAFIANFIAEHYARQAGFVDVGQSAASQICGLLKVALIIIAVVIVLAFIF